MSFVTVAVESNLNLDLDCYKVVPVAKRPRRSRSVANSDDENANDVRLSFDGKVFHDVKFQKDDSNWRKIFLKGIQVRRHFFKSSPMLWRIGLGTCRNLAQDRLGFVFLYAVKIIQAAKRRFNGVLDLTSRMFGSGSAEFNRWKVDTSAFFYYWDLSRPECLRKLLSQSKWFDAA